MNIGHTYRRSLSLFLIVALISFAPLASLQKASEAADLNKLLVGGIIGAAGLLAIGALAGPAATIGAMGAAGTGIVGAIGGTLGTIVTGVTAIAASMGKLSMSAVSTLGLMLGGAAIGIAGLLGTGFALVPLAVLGGGLLAYFMTNGGTRYGAQGDQRYTGVTDDPFFNAGSRLTNNQGGQSLSDKIRSIFDRDRRDDSFFSTNTYVDPNGMIRQGNDMMSQVDRFFNGTNSGYTGGQTLSTNSNNGYRTFGSGAMFSTDRSGRVTGSSSDYRGGFTAPRAAEKTTETLVNENNEISNNEKTLIEAEISRKEAYETLIRTMREAQNSDNDVSATLSSTLQSEEVQKAVNEYKAADKLLKELTGQLQHMEKQ